MEISVPYVLMFSGALRFELTAWFISMFGLVDSEEYISFIFS
jgi:hypothetical protein